LRSGQTYLIIAAVVCRGIGRLLCRSVEQKLDASAPGGRRLLISIHVVSQRPVMRLHPSTVVNAEPQHLERLQNRAAGDFDGVLYRCHRRVLGLGA
jgi:hypothetical protein